MDHKVKVMCIILARIEVANTNILDSLRILRPVLFILKAHFHPLSKFNWSLTLNLKKILNELMDHKVKGLGII